MEDPADRQHLDWRDGVLGVLICAATVLYLAQLPLCLDAPDEAKHLVEAKRILAGEVMYRDIFNLILPGWMYFMAGVFRLFGTTLATARMATAVIHGVTAALIFVACRQLDVRRALGCAAAVAYLVLCQPAFPVASNHWLATALTMVLLVLWLPSGSSPLRALAGGVVVGLFVAVHQQRGVSMGLGVATFLLVDAVLARRFGGSGTRLVAQGVALVGGALLVLVPLIAWLIARGGFDPLWHAVVVFPLTNYPARLVGWGQGGDGSRTFPRLLAALPVAIVVPFARGVTAWLGRVERDRVRRLTVLTVFAVFSVVSISYYPGFIHVAVAAPVFLVGVAEALKEVVRLLPARLHATVGWIVALAILGAGAWRLEDNLEWARGRGMVGYESAFGRVDIPPNWVGFFQRLRKVLDDDVPSRTLFVHPFGEYTYLLVDGRNPTRFQFINPGYHGAKEIQEVLDTLTAHPPPYVATMQSWVKPGDPIIRFMEQRYTPTAEKRDRGGLIWKLRPAHALPAGER